MTTEITAEITRIISELRATLPKGGRKQYPAAKHQVNTLTELGIIDAMPAGFGYSDAAEVIKQATTGKTSGAFMNAAGEGEDWSADATALFKLLNPAPAPVEPTPAADTSREGVYSRSEPSMGMGMTLSVEVVNGVAVREWVMTPYADYSTRNPDARWGQLGKTPAELNVDGFRKRPAPVEVWDDDPTDDPTLW